MLAARAQRWSPVVHFVDDLGALCGARPRAGKWLATSRLPVNCPRCLWAQTQTRLAFCQAPTGRSGQVLHVRILGPEGFSKSGRGIRTKSLCHATVGWDTELFRMDALRDRKVCGACRRELLDSAGRL